MSIYRACLPHNGEIWNTQSNIYIVSQGKMEHGGQMEHRVFWKIACQAWVYFRGHLISVIGQFSVLRRNQTCNRPRFQYRIKTKFHSFDKSVYSRFIINYLDKSSSRTAAYDMVKYKLCTVCSYVHIIWLSNGRYYSWHNALSPNVISGAKWNMLCWGKMALWDKMEWGKMAPFHLIPKGVSFCPNKCPGPFYPTPIPPTKMSVMKVIKLF